jgi:prepilin peptidase CpaA
MLTFSLALRLCALLATGIACATDLRARVIPNWLTLSAWGLACIAHGVHGQGAGLVAALLASVVCGTVPCFLFMRGGMGGGDVKLFAALGAFLGVGAGLEVQLHAFTLVALFAFGQALYQGRLVRLLLGAWRSARVLLRGPGQRPLQSAAPMEEVPMGGAIFVAVGMSVFRGGAW